ncbi:MAG TPA: tail fiber domain-containing protein, partial [Bacteroidales bacterium]|nr:tail fiber domain-containing protein [Bacteroidales bacterium]
FNLYKYRVANYRFFVSDATSNIGIGTGNPVYGKLEIKTVNYSDEANAVNSGITLNPGTYNSLRMYLCNNIGYITRGGANLQGIAISPEGNVGIKTAPSTSTNPVIALKVNGAIYASYNNFTGSDKRYKENIKKINFNTIAFDSIHSYTYTYKIKQYSPVFDDSLSMKMTDAVDTRTSFGFIAQEVRNIYPELVIENEEGMLAINYDGFIPILWEANKEMVRTIAELQKETALLKMQQSRIDDIERSMKTCCSIQEKPKLKSETRVQSEIQDQTKAQAELQQNKPNPFTQNTVIGMYIPQDVQQATVYVYDLKGTQILKLPVFEREQTEITIQAQQLQAGMYIYSLVTDGVLVGSKQMIVTE